MLFEQADYVIRVDVDGDGELDLQPVGISTAMGDLNGDGHQDLVRSFGVGSWFTGAIGWHENLNRFGEGVFGPVQQFAGTGTGAAVLIVDVDADGDLDVLSASDSIAWHQNIDRQGTFAQAQVINPGYLGSLGSPTFAAFTDIDGDGHADVVFAAESQVAWHRNRDGKGDFGPARVISTSSGDRKGGMDVKDLDRDGDLDVVVAIRDDSRIVWYENLDAAGNFSEEQLVATDSQNPHSLAVADVDGDGDLDILATSTRDNRLAWYESDLADHFGEERLQGDVNGDGEVSFDDFLVLSMNFAATDAVWEDGDFNGDSIVDFADFLLLQENFGRHGIAITNNLK